MVDFENLRTIERSARLMGMLARNVTQAPEWRTLAEAELEAAEQKLMHAVEAVRGAKAAIGRGR